MLWAIDAGNTHIVVGLHDGDAWSAVWRLATRTGETEDQLAATLRTLCDQAGLTFAAEAIVVASVAPPVDDNLTRLGEQWLGVSPRFLRSGAEVGIEVEYEPPAAVGADRIANALGAIALGALPAIVVDFGTATTFDAISVQGRYLGGAILPGVLVSLEALASHAAKLPSISLRAPLKAIGRDTVASMESGVVLGYAGAIDALAARINVELGGGASVVATGGLGEKFMGVAKSLRRYEPTLTLDGLRIAWRRWAAA
jgi:type III pantothenate kinase